MSGIEWFALLLAGAWLVGWVMSLVILIKEVVKTPHLPRHTDCELKHHNEDNS